MSALVISLAVMRCGNTMDMCCKFMKLSGSLVRVFWHEYPPNCKPNSNSLQNGCRRLVSRLFEAGGPTLPPRDGFFWIDCVTTDERGSLGTDDPLERIAYAFRFYCSPSDFWTFRSRLSEAASGLARPDEEVFTELPGNQPDNGTEQACAHNANEIRIFDPELVLPAPRGSYGAIRRGLRSPATEPLWDSW